MGFFKLNTNEEQFRNEIEEAVQENDQRDKSGMKETIHVNAQKDTDYVDDKWKDLKEIILKSARINIGYVNGNKPKKQCHG